MNRWNRETGASEWREPMVCANRRRIGSARIYVLLLGLLATGCLPEKRIVWSPDGSRAAVMSDDGLRIAMPDGKLSELLIPGARRAAWFADGRRMLVIVASKRARWDQIESDLSGEDRARVIELAQSLRTQVLAHTGTPDSFEPRNLSPVTPGQTLASVIYLRDKLPSGMAEKLGDHWKEIEKFELDLIRAAVFTIEGDRAVEGAKLLTGGDDLQEPSVSPSGRQVAFIRRTPMIEGGDSMDPNDLVVIPADGSAAQPLIFEHVAFGYGWSSDGRSLALIHTPVVSPKSVTVGAVATVEVVKEDGTLVDASNINVEDRVGLFFNQFGCVKYLADGRLIFSAHAATLPATDQEMPRSWSLYAWSPSMRAGSTRLLGRGADAILTDEQSMFEISPDGKRAVMYGGNGDTVVADLTTGETSVWFDTKEAGGTQSRPTWRNNDEVCAVTPDDVTKPKPEQWSVVLIPSEGAVRTLSPGWPEAAHFWREKPGAATAPASEKE